MLAPIYETIRSGFYVLTRKLVPEVVVSTLATLLVMVVFSHVMQPQSSWRAEAPRGDGQQTASSETVDFMERVALSHVGKPKSSSDVVAAAAATTEPTNEPAAVAPPARLAAAPGHGKPHVAALHAAASTTEVLPAPQPPQASSEPSVVASPEPPVVAEAAVVAEPAKEKPLHPLQYGMHFIATLVDFVPASGTRVVEGVTSIGDTLTSFAKKL